MGGPRRRWPWVVATLSLLVLTVCAGGIAWEQRTVAGEWRDRAQTMERQRDQALGRGDTLNEQLDETVARLTTSERDVADLEERVRALAGEKAQARDEATTIQVERDVFVELSGTVADAVEALDQCVTRLLALLDHSIDAYNATVSGEAVDVAPLNAASNSTTSFCDAARTAAVRAGGAADRLLRQ